MTPLVPPSAEELGGLLRLGLPGSLEVLVDRDDWERLIHEVERLRGVCDEAAEQLPRLVAGSTNWDALVKRLRAAAEGK